MHGCIHIDTYCTYFTWVDVYRSWRVSESVCICTPQSEEMQTYIIMYVCAYVWLCVCVCAHPVVHYCITDFSFTLVLRVQKISFHFGHVFVWRSRITSLGTPGTGLWNWDPERHIWHTFRDCSDGRSAGSTQPGSCGLVGMSQGVAREWTTHSRNLGQFDAAILTYLCATRATQGRKDESERPENATRQEL